MVFLKLVFTGILQLEIYVECAYMFLTQMFHCKTCKFLVYIILETPAVQLGNPEPVLVEMYYVQF